MGEKSLQKKKKKRCGFFARKKKKTEAKKGNSGPSERAGRKTKGNEEAEQRRVVGEKGKNNRLHTSFRKSKKKKLSCGENVVSTGEKKRHGKNNTPGGKEKQERGCLTGRNRKPAKRTSPEGEKTKKRGASGISKTEGTERKEKVILQRQKKGKKNPGREEIV